MNQKQLFSELSKNALHSIYVWQITRQLPPSTNTEQLPTSSLKN